MTVEISQSSPPVVLEHRCFTCSYPLIGVAIDGHCPECGTPADSSRRGWLLSSASKGYLSKLSRGLSMVLLGLTAETVVMAVLLALLFDLLGTGASVELMLVLSSAATAAGLGSLWGYWQFSAFDTGTPALDAKFSGRRLLRITLAISVAMLAIEFASDIIGYSVEVRPRGGLFQLLGWLVNAIAAVTWVVRYFACIRYIRLLARRVPDGALVNRCSRFLWLLPVIGIGGAALIGGVLYAVSVFDPLLGGAGIVNLLPLVAFAPLLALVMYLALLLRLRKHVRAVIATGAP